MSNGGRRTISLLEVDQKKCTLDYGEGLCTARLGVTGAHKCFKTQDTCQAPAVYAPATLTLRFAKPQDDLLQYGLVFPSVQQISTTPMAINLGGMDRSLSALGARESVTIKLQDHLHSDNLVDDYRRERSFLPAVRFPKARLGNARTNRHGRGQRPSTFRKQCGAQAVARSDFFGYFDATLLPYKRGTMFGKWIARNPFYGAFNARILEGYLGDALADMRTRHYYVERVEGPTNGSVTMVLRDVFTRIEARKAMAPLASQGRLNGNITAAAGSATLSPAGIGNLEYPASGRVRIGDEVIAFTRVADALTLTARHDLNTTAAAHEDQDLVQLVLTFTAQRAHVIVNTLATTYSQIPASLIDFAEWTVQAEELTTLYTADITEPTPVEDLIGELAEQVGFSVFPEVDTGMIRFIALRAANASPTVTDAAYIKSGSLSVKRQDEKRISAVWVYFGQINPTKSLDEKGNYHSIAISEDATAAAEHGTEAIRTVFSRWISQFGRTFALETGSRLLNMFRDPPLEVAFSMKADRAGELALAQPFMLETSDVQDELGDKKPSTMAPVEIRRSETDISVRAQGLTFSLVSDDGTRTIFLDSDADNVVLRAVYDSYYSTVEATVTFILTEGTTMGSASVSEWAVRTGVWPPGTVLNVTWRGRIQGKPGYGGSAGDGNGEPGGPGGPAFLAEYPVNVDNTSGQIWGGGGGGGAGVSSLLGLPGGGSAYYAGAGGGSGQGLTESPPGAPAPPVGATYHIAATYGGFGTTDAPGAGGTVGDDHSTRYAGPGGAGGAAGSAGASGGDVIGLAGLGVPGAGGAAGHAVDGNSFITWIATGDRRGVIA